MAQIKPFEKPICNTRRTLPDRAAVYRNIDETRYSLWLTQIGFPHLELFIFLIRKAYVK
jgi:hypothetical protein